MNKIATASVALTMLTAAGQASAANFKVEITNLTNANYFTPILVASHRSSADMFELGEDASAELQAIAEGGDVSSMQALLESVGADTEVAATESGAPVLAPGDTATAVVSNRYGNRRISLAAMILPTNDAFIGLDSVRLGYFRSRTFFLYGYDAGTETNDELMNPGAGGAPGVPGIPGDPAGLAGTNGTGVSSVDTNTSIHVHRGILGDDDPDGGASDLVSDHRWLNPVARVVITRVRR